MSKAIETVYHGCTDTRPARITASDSDGNRVSMSTTSSRDEAHKEAAEKLMDKMGWTGAIIGGGTSKGMVWVFLPNAMATAADTIEKILADEDAEKISTEDMIDELCTLRDELQDTVEKNVGGLQRIALVLKARFPWLGTEDNAGSGADVISTLADLYDEYWTKGKKA